MLDNLVECVKQHIDNHEIDKAIREMKKFRQSKGLEVKWNQFANTIISCTGKGKCISDIRKI